MQANPDFALEGWWVSQGLPYQDKIVIYRVDSVELNRKFWSKYKYILRKRFLQEEVYITTTVFERL